MTHAAIDRGRPGFPSETIRTAQARGPATARWLRLGLAGVLGAVAGAVLFPTRAEGAPPIKTPTRRRA